MTGGAGLPLVVFGAFDRHNFGDMLFPHLLAALLPGRALRFAGLAARDLTRFGGHRTVALDSLDGSAPAHRVHAGGEVLTCSAYEAAVMLLDAGAAAQAIARYDGDPAAAAAWAAQQLGTVRAVPYVAGREGVAAPGRLIFNAVGGVGWAAMPRAHRAEAAAALRQADWLGVRDHVTRAALRAEGIDAALCPDPAVMVKACCGETIGRQHQRPALQAVAQAFPQGYLACQFSGDFADDDSLAALAQALSRLAAHTGFGLALFRAGAAPWHDDRGLYDRLLQRLPTGTAAIFDSLQLWEICALIAASRGTLASSLHVRLVALAYGLPRVSLQLPQQGPRADKLSAFAETWEPPDLAGCVPAAQAAAAMLRALAVAQQRLRAQAAQLAATYRDGLAQWMDLLPAG